MSEGPEDADGTNSQLQGLGFVRAAVKELKSSYSSGETLLFTI